ncbi:Uncharacterised protein [Bergeyella zoohelcum]|nr:Uncharacterised protein [Bergeyella zoohelcum]
MILISWQEEQYYNRSKICENKIPKDTVNFRSFFILFPIEK